MKLVKNSYNQISKLLSTKHLTWVVSAVFLLLLIPICYLSFVNRATGDDYGYGAYTRAAWMTSHSLIQVVKAIGRTIEQYYDGWQGTWFSIAVFALQPEVFSDKAYVIVAFLMLFLWIGSTALLFQRIMRKEWGFGRWSYLMITLVYLIISIQFVPSTRSAIFWYNGCAHYMLPFAMCQIVVCLLLNYIKQFQVRVLVGITVLTTLLGGSNYQAALFALIVLIYAGIAGWMQKKNKKLLLLSIPLILEMIGLIISMKAPGNKVRGGEDFRFSVSRIAGTIGKCFVEGTRMILTVLREKPMVFVGLLILFLFFLEAFSKKPLGIKKIPAAIAAFFLFCLYCAMQAPALYAAVGVSGGVGNMNYMTFLLMMTGILAILANAIVSLQKDRTEKAESLEEAIHKAVVLPGLLVCLVLAVLCRSNVKSSTSWISMEYIRSGQAADYKQQMDLQTALLTDDETEDVVVPFINDVQGPLMQMPVTDNPQEWTNTVTREFYGKKSVIAIPREEWLELYGEGK